MMYLVHSVDPSSVTDASNKPIKSTTEDNLPTLKYRGHSDTDPP